MISNWVSSYHIIVTFTSHAYSFITDYARNKCIKNTKVEQYGPRASVVVFKPNVQVLVIMFEQTLEQLNTLLIRDYAWRNLDIPRVYCMNPPLVGGGDEHLFIITSTNYEPLLSLCSNADLVKVMVSETGVRVVADPDDDLGILCGGDGCFKIVTNGEFTCEECQNKL